MVNEVPSSTRTIRIIKTDGIIIIIINTGLRLLVTELNRACAEGTNPDMCTEEVTEVPDPKVKTISRQIKAMAIMHRGKTITILGQRIGMPTTEKETGYMNRGIQGNNSNSITPNITMLTKRSNMTVIK